MKTKSSERNSVTTPGTPLARLSGPHGYRFAGDTVHINAMFALLHPEAHERSWALQLWSSPVAPASAKELAGHLVAEVSLPPMGELTDETEHFEVRAFAHPPAGAGENFMVLVLASGRPGAFDEIHDMAVYPRRQEFLQPRMAGNVGYRLDDGRVQISVERVENPRPAQNLSGTLSLELWALAGAYAGGRFEGHHLAGVEIGAMSGQNFLGLQPLDLVFTPPPSGEWQIVLMLREWTTDGFVTRDFAIFPVRLVNEPVLGFASGHEVGESFLPVPAEADVAIVDEFGSTDFAPAEEIPAIAPAPRKKARARAAVRRVSINAAEMEELAAVKGLSEKLAERIVKNRPYESLAELGGIKGLNAKLLAKVRSKLKL